MKNSAGYTSLPHTGDMELKIWANDFKELLHQAALAILDCCDIQSSSTGRITKEIIIQSSEPEGILVSFLSELTFILEAHRFAYVEMEGNIGECQIEAKVTFSPVLRQEREIKAITWHRLKIRKTHTGLCVHIVVDI